MHTSTGDARKEREASECTCELARELLDQLVPALPPTLYAAAADARTHIVAILSALSPGSDSEPPERGMET